MPFRSVKQRKFLWKFHPEIARKWTREHGSKIVPKKRKRVKRKNVKRRVRRGSGARRRKS